jgi:hypothetical protein
MTIEVLGQKIDEVNYWSPTKCIFVQYVESYEEGLFWTIFDQNPAKLKIYQK